MAKMTYSSTPAAARWDYAYDGSLGGEDLLAHEAMRTGHIIVYRVQDMAAISQDASFYESSAAKQACRRLMLQSFWEERERFDSRQTQFGECFRRDEVGMDVEAFEASYVCFLAPMLSRNASVTDARRYCAERCFVQPWLLIHQNRILRLE